MNLTKIIGTFLLGTLLISCNSKPKKERVAEKEKVNILWVFGEDISPWMPAYGDSTVITPNIDFLVDNGVLFKNVFSMSAVCSPTRSAMITGAMPTTIGVHNHRSGRSNVQVALPEYVQILPKIFKEKGYHTFNEGKDDFNWQYNWDDYWTGPHKVNKFYGKEGHGSWNDRKEGQPFFGVIELFGGKNKNKPPTLVNPDSVKVPQYYPDIPEIRKQIAAHYNQIKMTDIEIAGIIEQLKKDNLYDKTIIIFMSDNGYKTPRDKQFLYDGGLHMPLVIASPGNPKLLNQKGVREDLVNLLDVTATTLALADIEIPKYMESKDVFAEDFHRNFVVAAKDRCDFTIDRVRAVRTKDFKYIKNFMTDRPLMQPQYRDNRPTFIALKKAFNDGVPFANDWLKDFRPAEELYNLNEDPDEVHNLANDPKYATELEKMRGRLNKWIKETGDKGQYPESKEQLKVVYERWGDRCVNPEYDVVKSE
ncbi:sulfatase [Cellulophaga lytica]|uniref:sulfatase family protein n=1 Tax=Cellulophaga lytica TaxID=979 RepID=UPI0026E16156|nr:sulfatase [Cellulophaga lytica]MDO6854082.1 sulfatase [Cellulophaga lytica]